MKIMKHPDKIVFDTDNPNEMKFAAAILMNDLTPLNHVVFETDFDFLTKRFKPKYGTIHPIMRNFGQSYYYQIKD